MTIFLNVLFLILGFAFLIEGANLFVTSASVIAKKLKISPLVIGLTIVAIGTSLPELAVSVTSAIKGVTDISIGNIVGSNIFNMLFCLGVVAILTPLHLEKNTKKIDFPFLVLLAFLLVLFCCDTFLTGAQINLLSRIESIVLIMVLVIYMFITIKNAKKERQPQFSINETILEDEPQKKQRTYKTWQIILYFILGLGGVAFGGECVSSTSQFLAIKMGMSEALVGITIVAVGTGLPELVSSIVAIKKGENDIALGNIIGSNILNIALILGASGAISQIGITLSMLFETVLLLLFTIIFVLTCLRRNKLVRSDGIFLVCLYIVYLTYEIVKNYCF